MSLLFFQHFYSVFQDRNHEPHSKCPLHASRDLYRIQEGNKTQEYAAKWVCHFCGKAFFSEHHLDVHFDNKHSDKLVKVRIVHSYFLDLCGSQGSRFELPASQFLPVPAPSSVALACERSVFAGYSGSYFLPVLTTLGIPLVILSFPASRRLSTPFTPGISIP